MCKRIVLITQEFYPQKGGIANYLHSIIEPYFNNSEILIITNNKLVKSSNHYEVKHTTFKLFNSTKYRIKETDKILEILKEFKPDFVLIGYLRAHPEVIAKYSKIDTSCKFVLVAHAKEVFFNKVKINNINKSHKGYNEIEIHEYKKILQKFNLIITVSNFTKDLISKFNKKIVVIYPKIKISNFKKSFKKDKLKIITVGRLVKRKGHEELIQVLFDLKNNYDFKYTIIGDGPEKNKLIKQITKLNLNDRIKILSNLDDDDLVKHYIQSDIFILNNKFIPPNDIEGLGLVFLEANSHYLPVIGGEYGGPKEIIFNNKNGFLIKNKYELKERLIYLLENNSLIKKMGLEGFQLVKNKFSKMKLFHGCVE